MLPQSEAPVPQSTGALVSSKTHSSNRHDKADDTDDGGPAKSSLLSTPLMPSLKILLPKHRLRMSWSVGL